MAEHSASSPASSPASSQPSPSAAPTSGDPHPAMSEAEFLQQEAAKARAAMQSALSDFGKHLKEAVDPHQLTREHPWIAVSTAAVAGFAAATTLIPSRQQQALKALAEIERARHAPPPPPTSDKKETASGIGKTVAAELLKMVRPVVTALLSAGVSRMAENPFAAGMPGGPDGSTGEANGHSPQDEISSPS